MTSHNNYDVAVLLQLGWLHMRADQRRRAREDLARLVDWCLAEAIAPGGEIVARAVGDSLPEGTTSRSHFSTPSAISIPPGGSGPSSIFRRPQQSGSN
jgi:hypothetical protein